MLLSNDNLGREVRRAVSRARRFRFVCYGLAALLLVIGAARLVTTAFPLIDPLLNTARLECNPCVVHTDPVLLLAPGPTRLRAWQTPGAAEQIVDRVRRFDVKLMLFAAEAMRSIPFFVMFLSLALALRSFARAGFNSGAVRWIRRSALAALVWTLAQPISMSIRWTAFSPITHGRELRHVVFDGNDLLTGILIAGAAWVVAWALGEALVMQRDLEEYV